MSMTIVWIINIQQYGSSLKGGSGHTRFGKFLTTELIDYASWMEQILRGPIIGKRVKIFKKRADEEPYVTLDKTRNEEQLDKGRGDAESEESGLQLVIDIRGESESATEEDE